VTFIDPHVSWREYQLEKERLALAREHVLWCADQVNLAVYHKRPEAEIDGLLERLRIATGRE
jgi:hypothetical protein